GLYGTRGAAEGDDQRLGGRSRRRRPTERRSSRPKTRSGSAGSAVPDPDHQPVLCAGGEASSARNRGISLLGGRRSIAARRRWIPWEVGAVLPVDLDFGVDLNAFYDREGLKFFHGSAAGRTVFSGESPDIVCHELGHALLDSFKPQLFDAASIE